MSSKLVAIAVLISFLHLATTAHAEPFKAGLNAIERQHYATAFRSFLPLAQEGAAEAQNNLGFLYQHGYGVKRNYALAVDWYKRAAQKKLPEAEHNLGMLNYLGHGMGQDFNEAKRWFEKAAKGGLADSQYMLGRMFFKGEGVVRSPTRAQVNFRDAALQGFAEAQYMYSYMLLSANSENTSGSKGLFKWLDFSGQADSDLVAALMWAEIAVMNGQSEANQVAEFARYQLTSAQVERSKEAAQSCLESNYAICITP